MNQLQTVYQIHLCLNQAMYLFEDLPAESKFLETEQPMYNRIVQLCENLSKELQEKQNDKYTYQLKKVGKVVRALKIPTRI